MTTGPTKPKALTERSKSSNCAHDDTLHQKKVEISDFTLSLLEGAGTSRHPSNRSWLSACQGQHPPWKGVLFILDVRYGSF